MDFQELTEVLTLLKKGLKFANKVYMKIYKTQLIMVFYLFRHINAKK